MAINTVAISLFLFNFITILTNSLIPLIPNKISHINYYYAQLKIGQPPQDVSLMVDTSCSHTYLASPDDLNLPKKYQYSNINSHNFSWLHCMDEEYCNICLEESYNQASNESHCGWEFACEQLWTMAKDTVCLNDDECYTSPLQSDSENYLVFGYNIQNEEASHAFSMEKQNDDIIMGGVLSLNREITSFIQHFYLLNDGMERQFAHYLHQQNGHLAIGGDVDQLLDLLNIGRNDLTWIRYYNHESSAMYRVQLEQIELMNTLENEVIFENNTAEYLDILTFDTAISGIAMNEIWQDDILTFIQNVSDVALIQNTYYPYCIDTDHDNILDDLYNKLPEIKISLPSKIGRAGYEFIISPQQYVVQIDDEGIDNPFCLDISFDWDEGICLGSLAMNNYLVIYNEDAEAIGVYDKNLNHQRQQNSDNQNNDDSFDFSEQENEYVYALSMALMVLLICFLLLTVICGCLLRRKDLDQQTEGMNAWHIRGKSVTVDAAASPRMKRPVSPVHVAMNAKPKDSIELDSRSSNDNIVSKGKNRRELNVSISSSVTPFGSYYDGNIKSIVYDRVIEPWMEDDDIDAI